MKKESARRALYDMYAGQMYRAIFRITNQHEDAEDVLQQSFVKIFNKLETYNSESGTVFSWMYRICINESISLVRKKKFHFLEIDDARDTQEETGNVINQLNIEYIHYAIKQLPDINRIIFSLYEIEGFSHQEISDQLMINVATSRSYLSRAKLKLRGILNHEMSKINSL